MKALLVGIKPVQFTPRGESIEKVGLSVFYTAESPEVIGLHAGDFWIDKAKSPIMYNKLLEQDYLNPVSANLIYEVIPGRKNPVLIAIEFDNATAS